MKTKVSFFMMQILVASCNKENEYPKLKAKFIVGNTLLMEGKILDLKNTSDSISTNYFWDFGDGHNSTRRHPTYYYSSPDAYTIELQVSDNAGNTDKVTHNVKVGDRYIYNIELLSINEYKYFSPTNLWDEGCEGINANPDIYLVITNPNDRTPIYETNIIDDVN